jgi:hypothetical protein
MGAHVLRAFITYLLVHIHQKRKIALEIAAKIANVNRPLSWSYTRNKIAATCNKI